MTPDKTQTHLFQTARLLAALLLLSGIAAANTLTPTGLDSGKGMNLWIDKDGRDVNVWAGVVLVSVSQNGHQFADDVLCGDLFTSIHLGETYSTQALDPDQVPGKDLTRAAWLVDNALIPMQLTQPYGSALPKADWITSQAQGAGAQLALWDIIHDGGDGFSAGKVRADVGATDASALSWANVYESLSSGHSSDFASVYSNTNLCDGVAAQTLIGPEPTTPHDSPTPEPAAFLLVGAGLFAGSVALRRARPGR